jgi:flagellar motor switch protein FliM
MEQILSQEEIDALLKGISDGEIETQKEVPPEEEHKAEAARFDFVKYTRGKKDKLPGLDFIYDRFSKTFRSALSLFVEKEVEITPQPIQYIGYGDFVATLPLPTNMNIVVTENLKGFFIVIFDAKLIFSVLETIFGSSSLSKPKVEGREFTKIEFNVIKKVIDLISLEMEKAWEPVYPLRCKYSRSEINPNYIAMVTKEETVGFVEFSVEVGETRGWMKICVPYGVLESIKGHLSSTPSREDAEMREKWYGRLRDRVYDLPLEVRAVLGRKRTSLKQFLKMVEDKLVIIDRYVNDAVEVEVDNKTKFRGKMGVFKGNKAIRIEEVVQ